MNSSTLKTLSAIGLACTLMAVPLASHAAAPAQASHASPAAQPTSAGTPGPGGAPGAGGQLPGGRSGLSDVVAGRLAGITAQAVQLQSFSGVQSIARYSSTRFFVASAASAADLKAGERVTVRFLGDATQPTMVTIAPSGGLYGFVQALSNSGTQPSGTSGPGMPAGTPGAGNPMPVGTPPAGKGTPVGTPGRGNGNPGRFMVPTAGTVTSVQGTKLTIKTAQGKTATYTLSSKSEIYMFSQVSADNIHAGFQVSVTTATVGGHMVAVAVSSTSITNATAYLTAKP